MLEQLMPIEPTIELVEGEVPGYGGPGYWWFKIISDNKLLEEGRSPDQRYFGRLIERAEVKWRRVYDEGEWRRILDAAPLASNPCYHCGKPTYKGTISCVNKTFCYACDKAGFIEQYRNIKES